MDAATKPGHRYATAREALRAHWGYDDFRGIQAEVIETVLQESDALALMPTGGGKSLCYQIPALIRPGVCVVVSPLIALMKDQVESLRKRGIRAAALYAGLSRREQEAVYDRAQFGGLDLLYLSPERLLSDWTRTRLAQTKVSLLAVDEAHCISQWGQDFRPAYRRIAEIRKELPGVPVLALTATATPRVADDICEQLGFGLASRRHQMSFARENLIYAVRHTDDKLAKLVKTLQAVPGSAVVYAGSRGRTREIASELQRRHISAGHYHAGLTLAERDTAQAAWLSGNMRVMVATNAFGMGIDKPDVRLVVHVDVPDNLEGYFQEAGRGGRDGERAYALLLYRDSDADDLKQRHARAHPEPDDIKRVYHMLGNYCNLALGAGLGAEYEFDVAAFAKTYTLDPHLVVSSLQVLQAEGIIYVSDAVYRPAMIHLQASREELYDYCLRNPRLDKLLQVLLRTHRGIHEDSVYLKEHELARHLGMVVADLRNQLELLMRQKILDFRPQGELPLLTWTLARSAHTHLALDWRRLREREATHLRRIESAISYAGGAKCRAQILLDYFGESTEPCGRCDFCQAHPAKATPSTELLRYAEKIQAVLLRQALTPAQLLESFVARHHPQVQAATQLLLEEGAVVEQHGRLSLISTSVRDAE